jgi:GH24 family phage-related lysozyme (muramidase)
MATFKQLIQQILAESMDVPPAIHQSYEYQFNQNFINYVKSVENGVHNGYDKKRQLWFPIRSVEGGSDTIAYGHKLRSGENFSKGITEDQASQLLIKDLNIARAKVKHEIDSEYGIGLFNTLLLPSQEMLIDFTFNLGSLRSFPKFVRGVLTNDKDIMRKEYRRYMGGKELTNRNKVFFDRYLKS